MITSHFSFLYEALQCLVKFAVHLEGVVVDAHVGWHRASGCCKGTHAVMKEGKVSNPNAVQAVSNLAKSANGARVGFELTK